MPWKCDARARRAGTRSYAALLVGHCAYLLGSARSSSCRLSVLSSLRRSKRKSRRVSFANGTIGPSSPRVLEPNEGIVTVLDSFGARSQLEGGEGPNLFHSFERLDIAAGDTLAFAPDVSGVDTVESIFVRVTGGRSSIAGTVVADRPADVFFLNPNGFLFTERAMLNTQGAFVAAAASSLVFEDQVSLGLSDTAPPTLSDARPAELRFSQDQVDEDVRIVAASLDATDVPSLVLAAPSIQITQNGFMASSLTLATGGPDAPLGLVQTNSGLAGLGPSDWTVGSVTFDSFNPEADARARELTINTGDLELRNALINPPSREDRNSPG